MKLRNGFVSNSSTSSFVLLVRKDVHDKVVADMSKPEQAMIKAFFVDNIMHITKVFGIAAVETDIFMDAGGGGTWENFTRPDTDSDDEPYDLMEKYEDAARKQDASAVWSADVGDGG